MAMKSGTTSDGRKVHFSDKGIHHRMEPPEKGHPEGNLGVKKETRVSGQAGNTRRTSTRTVSRPTGGSRRS
jgi:hypothetical protein